MQPLEPFVFDKEDIKSLARHLEKLVCEPAGDKTRDEHEISVRSLSEPCASNGVLTLRTSQNHHLSVVVDSPDPYCMSMVAPHTIAQFARVHPAALTLPAGVLTVASL